MTSRILMTKSTNPHDNLALEDALFSTVKVPTLYLWQNRHTIVIGRNQNAWRECDTALLKEEGGTLARRTSGGGAVYHDLGNLNFSFIMPIEQYDLSKQLSCVLEAVRKCGIEAEFSGRNDIVAKERKFSGNAFKFSKTAGLHHGTLLINSDFSVMGRYLQVSKEKMESKGVASVQSRVINLSECAQNITHDEIRSALCESFSNIYGGCNRPAEPTPSELPNAEKRAFFASWEWNFGQSPVFGVTLSRRFEFGEVTIGLSVEKGHVSDVKIYTDANDAELADLLLSQISGQPACELGNKTASLNTPETAAIAEWLKSAGY